MTPAERLAILRRDNPMAREDDLRVYSSALGDWLEADRNLREHGLIALHPRTGAPFDNPYVTVRDRAARVMLGLKHVKTAALWTAIDSGGAA